MVDRVLILVAGRGCNHAFSFTTKHMYTLDVSSPLTDAKCEVWPLELCFPLLVWLRACRAGCCAHSSC